jgi:hypothetical protein
MKPLRFNKILLVTAFAVLAAAGCKDDDDVMPEPAVVGGKGGNAMINLIPQQNYVDVDSCMVYIKYNTLDMPLSYDDSVWVATPKNGRPTGTFSSLKRGNYYLYAYGWNKYNSEIVGGGMPYTITTDYVDAKVEIPVYTIRKVGAE